jgi:class 3 adenylate cyclase/DNA-binding winged helix-turn-helix (wHTH) protein
MQYVFGDYTLDTQRYELWGVQGAIPLGRQEFRVLAALLDHADQLVTRQELFDRLWPGLTVSDAALERCIARIRRVLGDTGQHQRCIKTVHGVGYRFMASVAVAPATGLQPPVAWHAHRAPPAPLSVLPPLPHVQPATGPSAAATPSQAVGLPCPQCYTVNRAMWQFCATCGHELWRPCPQCGFSNGPRERFYGGCGHEVATVAPVTTGTRGGPPRAYTPAHRASKVHAGQQAFLGERKLVTVMVAGVQGLRELVQAGDPDEVDALLNRGFTLAVAEVHRVEGFVTQVAGDGFIAIFGAPLACEDHVVRALHAALGLQRAFAAYAAELQQTYHVSLTLRLGVHTGPLVVSAISDDLQLFYTTPGVTFRIATGLQHLAQDGTIAVSQAVQQQAAGFFQFAALGLQTFPDVAEPVSAYACTGPAAVASRLEAALARHYTPFHGRTQELALLETCWTRVCRSEGQVVCLLGEAGIGKSRLAYEFQQHLGGVVRRLTAQTLSYGQAMPYHALLPLLRTLLAVTPADTPEQQYQALHARLAAIAPTLAAETPLLAHVLGVPCAADQLPALTPEVQRRRVQQACLQVLTQLAATIPLCLLIEDGHWLDPSSHEFLALLVSSLARRPIMLLCTARPGFRHTWTDHTYFHQVAIARLPDVEVEALVSDILQPYDTSAALRALAHARARGNPFFVEELVRALREQGLLTLQGDVYALAAETHVTLPTSIQGIVQARLDRLPAAEKQVLQAASVIGPEVAFPLLYALVGGRRRCYAVTSCTCRRRSFSMRRMPYSFPPTFSPMLWCRRRPISRSCGTCGSSITGRLRRCSRNSFPTPWPCSPR